MAKLGESIQPGTGNVFSDLGFSDAGERKLKVQLAIRLNDLIREGGLTQGKAAKLFSVPQPHVSDLKNYKLNRFSSERLMYFMTLLDRDVEIHRPPDGYGTRGGGGIGAGRLVAVHAGQAEDERKRPRPGY